MNVEKKVIKRINQLIGAICGIKKYKVYNFNLTN